MKIMISEAIENIEKEIVKRQKQLELLKEFENSEKAAISEEDYHELCKTILRTSDILAQTLAKNFPFLTLKSAGANYICFTDNDYEGVEVWIPNSRGNQVEIIFDKWTPTKPMFKRDWNEEYLNEQKAIFEKMKIIVDKKSSFKDKVAAAYRKDRIVFSFRAYLLYFFNQKQIKKNAQDKCDELILKIPKLEKKAFEKREQEEKCVAFQEAYIEDRSKRLLEWTDTVVVRQKGYLNNEIRRIKKELGGGE